VTITELIDLAGKLTVTLLLLIAVWGSFRGWYVPGWIYRQALDAVKEMREERDEYKRELFGSLGVADRATRVAEHTTERVTRKPPFRGDDR